MIFHTVLQSVASLGDSLPTSVFFQEALPGFSVKKINSSQQYILFSMFRKSLITLAILSHNLFSHRHYCYSLLYFLIFLVGFNEEKDRIYGLELWNRIH